MLHHQVQSKPLRFHLSALAGCLFFTIILELVIRGRFFSNMFPMTFTLMFAQMELFAWIGSRIFRSFSYSSVNEFIRKVIVRLLLFYLIVIVLGALIFVIVGLIWGGRYGVSASQFLRELPEKELRGFVIGSSFGILIGTVIFFFMELVTVIRREQQLNEEKMRYHYEVLKNQMNPHFLFNSLNTLSSIIYKDVELADRFISKLSLTYRYILDTQDDRLVSLEQEIAFVRDYFYLQQLRDGERIKMDIDIENPQAFMILPVSLQLLVENALKHNAASIEKPLIIRISLENGNEVVVRNNRQPKQQLNGSFRIGLKNLAERVRIITGKELTVEERPDFFSVKLPLTEI